MLFELTVGSFFFILRRAKHRHLSSSSIGQSRRLEKREKRGYLK